MSNNSKTKVVVIRCNSQVKKFTLARITKLGLDVGLAQLYKNLVRDGSTTCKRDAVAVKLAEQLLKFIPSIRPRFPLTTAEVNEMTQFVSAWKERISGLVKERQYAPIYYKDIVNQLLTNKTNVRCSKKHLEWCLSILGPDNMKPGKIADTILKYDAQSWEEVKPLAKNDHYSVRLDDYSKETQEDFRNKIEFIYKLSTPSVGDTLIGQLQNDIQVIAEVKKWCNDDHSSYNNTIAEYLEFIRRLQTVTSSILPRKLIRKMESMIASEQMEAGEVIDEVKEGTEAIYTEQSKAAVLEPKSPATSANESLMQNLSQKEDDAKTVIPFTPDNGDSSPIIKYMSSEEDMSNYPDEVPGEPGDDELNYRDLMEYLNEKVRNDLSGKEKLMNAKEIIYAFCKLEDFSKRFEQLRVMIDSGTVKWPGGFAVGEMRKMLNPEYVPNIR